MQNVNVLAKHTISAQNVAVRHCGASFVIQMNATTHGTHASSSHGWLNTSTSCEHSAHTKAAPQCTKYCILSSLFNTSGAPPTKSRPAIAKNARNLVFSPVFPIYVGRQMNTTAQMTIHQIQRSFLSMLNTVADKDDGMRPSSLIIDSVYAKRIAIAISMHKFILIFFLCMAATEVTAFLLNNLFIKSL